MKFSQTFQTSALQPCRYRVMLALTLMLLSPSLCFTAVPCCRGAADERWCRRTSTPEMIWWRGGPSPWTSTTSTCCCRVSVPSTSRCCFFFGVFKRHACSFMVSVWGCCSNNDVRQKEFKLNWKKKTHSLFLLSTRPRVWGHVTVKRKTLVSRLQCFAPVTTAT